MLKRERKKGKDKEASEERGGRRGGVRVLRGRVSYERSAR